MRSLAWVALTIVALAQGPAGAVPPASFVVEMREFAFRPAVLRIPAGRPVALRLVNRGQLAHQFGTEMLAGLAVTASDARMYLEFSNLEVLRLQPGASAVVSFVPRRPGRFPFACTIEGHREAGMVGVFEVY